MSEDKIQIEADSGEHEVSFLLKEENIALIQQAVEAAGLVVTSSAKPLTKVKLAYPIKQNNYAFLGSLSFKGTPEQLGKLINELKLNNNVVRYLVTRSDKLPSFSAQSFRGTVPRSRFRGRSRKTAAEPILTNEAIEKKIEEILK